MDFNSIWLEREYPKGPMENSSPIDRFSAQSWDEKSIEKRSMLLTIPKAPIRKVVVRGGVTHKSQLFPPPTSNCPSPSIPSSTVHNADILAIEYSRLVLSRCENVPRQYRHRRGVWWCRVSSRKAKRARAKGVCCVPMLTPLGLIVLSHLMACRSRRPLAPSRTSAPSAPKLCGLRASAPLGRTAKPSSEKGRDCAS